MTRKEFDKKYLCAKKEEEKNEACLEYIFFLEKEIILASQTSNLLGLFRPIEFTSSESLHLKAKGLNRVPYKGADDILYLHHIAATLYKEGHNLFYFKKQFSEEELELLIKRYNYQEVEDKPNIYISSNHNTGVLYVVENLTKEP